MDIAIILSLSLLFGLFLGFNVADSAEEFCAYLLFWPIIAIINGIKGLVRVIKS